MCHIDPSIGEPCEGLQSIKELCIRPLCIGTLESSAKPLGASKSPINRGFSKLPMYGGFMKPPLYRGCVQPPCNPPFQLMLCTKPLQTSFQKGFCATCVHPPFERDLCSAPLQPFQWRLCTILVHIPFQWGFI